MDARTEFTIRSDVVCSETACGILTRVAVDPVTCELTHLVVGPSEPLGNVRLVPVDLVASTLVGSTVPSARPAEIRLRCAQSEFEALDAAEESQFLEQAGGRWGYGPGQILYRPPRLGRRPVGNSSAAAARLAAPAVAYPSLTGK